MDREQTYKEIGKMENVNLTGKINFSKLSLLLNIPQDGRSIASHVKGTHTPFTNKDFAYHRKKIKKTNRIITLLAVCAMLLQGVISTGCKNNKGSGDSDSTVITNPLDIKDKVVFIVKSSRVTRLAVAYDLKTGQKEYKEVYPCLGDLSYIELFSDTTGILVQENKERNSVRCKYVEDNFHGEIHKAIVFLAPNPRQGAVLITEDYKVKVNIPAAILNEDSKSILSYAFELSNNLDPDYILEKQNNSSSERTNADSTLASDQQPFITASDMIDLLSSYMNKDSKFDEILKKYGLSEKYESPFETNYFFKNCKLVPVDEEITINTGKEVDIEHNDIKACVIRIYEDARQGTYYQHVEAIVFDKNCIQKWDKQLKAIGYEDNNYNYQKKGAPTIYIREKDDSYILELEFETRSM